ncbi:amidase [Patulibacter sp.]|uniref:amidase n=1 Tax=Patulibacter sp. TaxID=1912859 RepID=UPI002723AAB7|nr:amidase [Patulibacter sp.]MDO9406773.1 amidase [Patulibacter sp.]
MLAAGGLASSAHAYNYVPSSNGESWGVQDAAAPRVDTGSIRDTTSNALTGFGGIRVKVSTDALRNGELVRGFGLRFDPPERFTSTTAVDMGGVAISRQMRFNRTANWGRWLDTFKNTTDAPITVDVSFGGQTGVGNTSGSTNGIVSDTSSGDATINGADSWALTRFGTAPAPSTRAPSAIVFGSAAPYGGALTRTGNFRERTFTEPRAAAGHDSNFIGYEHRLVLQPGQTRTLAHFVVIGTAENSSTTGPTVAGTQVAAVRSTAQSLTTAPSFNDLTKAEICALANWDVAAITTTPAGAIPAFDAAADCPPAGAPAMPSTAAATPTTTGSTYDVMGKSIGTMQADMAAGRTTSQQITRAYLDRIAAYDVGPFGFNSYTTVAKDAMAQAKAADDARAAGKRSPVLGIPLTIKDLYDTKDMPTTNGSLVFEGYQPPDDATSVARLRAAGAIILGKASLEEYALSGQYSDSAFGIVWNAFSPSKSALASSGGPAVATAADLAAGSLGSQTGDSLYAPASAASLYTLRGTDGMESLAGLMPLSWLQDYGGAITRSMEDLADILDITTGTDPRDAERTAEADARRPKEWRDTLDPDALKGKRIGYYDAAFVDPFGTTGTTDAQKATLKVFEDAGATLVKITGGPASFGSVVGDRAFQGWVEYIKTHPNLPYQDAREILANQKRLPYRRSANGYTGTGAMTETQIAAYKKYRADAKLRVGEWLDTPPTPTDADTGQPSPGALDAVVFPGLRSTISLNDGNAAAFGRGDPPTNSAGAPSVSFPATTNDDGEPTNLQLVGRAWDDGKLMGYAYAFDRIAKAHVAPTTAPKLAFRADPTPPVIDQPTPIAPQPSPIGPPPAPAAPPTAGTPVATPLRTVRLTTRTVTLDSKGRFALKVSCAKGVSSCRVRVLVRRGSAPVASRTLTIRAGRTVTMRVRPSASMRRSLLRGRTVTVKVSLSGAGVKGVTANVKVRPRR